MSQRWHDLNTPPNLPELYWKAATRRKITGTELPADGLRYPVSVQPAKLAAYRQVCGFTENGLLPPTYPHVLAFALQMQLLTASDFPFPLLGLIHLANRIRVLRPMGGVGDLSIGVRVDNLRPHAKGAVFDLLTNVDDALGPLWEAQSQMLCRGVKLPGEAPAEPSPNESGLSELARWQAPADIGRRYARVSGDYNPIHLSAMTARLFGFPQAIAHGLWNKARTLAALGEELPAANIEIAVDFRKPVRLPSEVCLLASPAGPSGDLRLTGAGGLEHMIGHWRPLA
ncbi:MaoC/PaaZ C-terminal domain-containing protein [Pseudomonas sp. MRSN 12121]|uniref:MaoC family dehydratase n=1 Tax=Pseudomonas sp. MRSN 12121 TaxID=1611770 RepID=UPI0005BEA986|nr:MaoC/PaaZ C-terminal domain-containing protein [Pseudomonas sp. MRSN 12121]AJO76379.1 acyl dehydratase [Pseudomonas sp. MRSN 12121]